MNPSGDDPIAPVAGAEPTKTIAPEERPPAPPRGSLEDLPRTPNRGDPGRYRIIGEHGRGGLGRVTRAHDLALGRDVAIKELISPGVINEVRFVREAMITARLEHPGIVPVHEAGRWPDGTPFYAMKLVSGRPLRDLMNERTAIADRIALLHHVIAIADAIAYAHGKNIVHRDLKPSNVIIGDFGETIVIDWGLAKDVAIEEPPTVDVGPFRTRHDPGLTTTGTVLGTPAYMAPEQARGERVDQRADVYAIGAMLWELCTIEKLRPDDTLQRRAILRRSGIDADLIAIIDKAVAPDPAQRYPDAAALAADLKAFKSGARIAARDYSLLAVLSHWTRRHRAIALASIIGTMIALIVAILYVHNVTEARDRAASSLASARAERDRAQLAEAALLLDKDPTRATALLSTIKPRSAQHALLLSRARPFTARGAFELPGTGLAILQAASAPGISVVTGAGALVAPDMTTGKLETIDDGVKGAAAETDHGSWIYARRHPDEHQTMIVDTAEPTRPIAANTRLDDLTGVLLQARSHVYALENKLLYDLTQSARTPIASDVRAIAGSRHLLLICTTTGVLTIARDGREDVTGRCAQNLSKHAMVAVDDDYAFLADANTIVLHRNHSDTIFPTHVTGEYSLSLSASGLFALADNEGGAWLVRPGEDHLEAAPSHPGRPTAVAASDTLAAWGFSDGGVLVRDTGTSRTWEFKGHGTYVSVLAIDAQRREVTSVAGSELRVWSLSTIPVMTVAAIPGNVFNVVPSPDGALAALDGNGGAVRLWSLADDRVVELHRHKNSAFSIAWWQDRVCSGGFDGTVLCSKLGGETIELAPGTESIRWITTDNDHRQLAISTASGDILTYDGTLHPRFSHHAKPYRMAFSMDGRFLASGAFDGTLILYDTLSQRVSDKTDAHVGWISSVVWDSDHLWTTGADGAMKQWATDAGRLAAIAATHRSGPIRSYHRLHDGWLANLDGHILLISLAGRPRDVSLDLGRHIERIEVAPDQRYVAVTYANETAIVDLADLRISTVSLESNGVSYVGFTKPHTLTITTGTQLQTLALDKLSYFTFE